MQDRGVKKFKIYLIALVISFVLFVLFDLKGFVVQDVVDGLTVGWFHLASHHQNHAEDDQDHTDQILETKGAAKSVHEREEKREK